MIEVRLPCGLIRFDIQPFWQEIRMNCGCSFSNGGFGGIHGKLLERLGRR